jgi:triosephosphate isomerase
LRTLILNFKNYNEVLGRASMQLARAAEQVAAKTDVEIILAPPTTMLGAVAAVVKLPVFAQAVDSAPLGQTTGAVPARMVKASGASGTLLNHSERRLVGPELEKAFSAAREAGLKVCLCSATVEEAVKVSALAPEYLALEPPELIGTGVAVSRARPELISESVKSLRTASYKGSILCGAGIVGGDDVTKAIGLGAEGVLVASSVVKAKNWGIKILELARPLE